MEPQYGNRFIFNEPGHHKRDFPVHKAALLAKGINFDEYQVEYDSKRAGNCGGTITERRKIEAMQDRVVEPLEWVERETMADITHAGVVAGVTQLTMARRDQLHKHTLFR